MKTTFTVRSLRFRIALAFSLVFLVITAISSFFIYQNIERQLTEAYQTNLKQEANNLLDRVGVDPIEVPLTTEEQSFMVWLESGFDIIPIFDKPGFPTSYQTIFEELQSLEARPMAPLDFLSIDSLDLQMVSRDLDGFQRGRVKLLLAKDNRAFRQQLKRIRDQIFGAIFLAVILSAGLAYVVSGLALRPVQRVIDKARTIQAAEQMERLPVSKVKDEIGQLSDTINDMIGRIEGSIQNQNRFFAMAAHELRTPLANMQSELEYYLTTSDKNLNADMLPSLREEVIRLKNIVQDFLLMSQLKANTLVLRTSAFRLDDLLYDTLERMRPLLTKSGFEVKLSIYEEPEALKTEADREKIEAVLVNLLDNCRKYGSNTQPIHIYLSVSGQSPALSIENTIETHDKRMDPGMGLGLQVAAQIVEKHGFAFQKTEEGSQFKVEIKF